SDPFYSEILTEPGTYQYYVQALYGDGESLPTDILSVGFPFLGEPEEPSSPMVTMLMANYPNPFNPDTRISFNLASSGKVRLQIFNLRGQLVKTLCDMEMSSGTHSFVWNGRDGSNHRVASGVYFYRLSAPLYTRTRKMLLLK
ncbi:MAG: FlgD immunoglobulin-like domain containing protein, partial [Candidatus Cloacimonadaceae bacterium]|nr:FlgD immunoglobulin-like domain containing protein [Candidatus Cloacimonadaceae bacterium]